MSVTSVDDVILISNSKPESNLATQQINEKFTTTDCGDANWILGCCITWLCSKHLLMIDQSQFISMILREFGMHQCKSVHKPCPKWCLTSDMSPKTDDKHKEAALLPFWAVVGKCMYLSTCTCPDISYAVRELAHFMLNYGTKYFKAAKHLLQYLKGTRSCGIIYGDTNNLLPTFHSFTDSNWAMSEGCKSISSYVILCGGGPLTRSSKQQTIVALSSCEAEHIACAHCAQQIVWLCALFNELGFSGR